VRPHSWGAVDIAEASGITFLIDMTEQKNRTKGVPILYGRDEKTVGVRVIGYLYRRETVKTVYALPIS